MKKFLFAAILAVIGALPAFASDPVLGLWQTEVDDGSYAFVDIHMCGAGICGTMVRTFDANGEYQSENLGKDIIRNMHPVGGGKYEGEVWRPSNDKIYFGKLDLRSGNNKLKMKGCIAGGLLCSSQTWTRIQ